MCSVLARALVRLKHLLQVCPLFFENSLFLLNPGNYRVNPAAVYQEQSYHACVCHSRRLTRQYDLYVEWMFMAVFEPTVCVQASGECSGFQTHCNE